MRDRAKGFAAVAKTAIVSMSRRLLQQVLPLVLALYTNHRYLRAEDNEAANALPEGGWANGEADGLLSRSEGRLETLESKGPGLATVCGIAAAAIGVAISLTWGEATTVAKVVLVVAGAYSLMSLYAPVTLVGPVRRVAVTQATVEDAAAESDPAGYLARWKARAATVNDLTTLRLSNLQAASRNDARNAIILFAVWAIVALVGHATLGSTSHL
jgi:hypothetical protein